eukprot:m.7673 g.7673  ORF g.7673 m.7673 type:complete len:65 (+) comp5275_c0_seq1:106-300(+)
MCMSSRLVCMNQDSEIDGCRLSACPLLPPYDFSFARSRQAKPHSVVSDLHTLVTLLSCRLSVVS